LNPTQVGFYSVAWGLVNKINQIPESIGTILFQRVANEKSEMIRDFIIRVYKSTIYILSLISIFLFIFIKPLINFLFPGFEQAITPAKILIPGIVMFGLYIVLSGVFLGRGKVNFYLLNTSIMALLNIFLNVILIPKFGIKGAAVASTTSLTISNLTGLIYFSKLFKVKIHQMIFPNNDDFKELYNNWLQILKVKKRFLYTNNIK
jgi:O-antigen/teichoic acid export membrane protein